MAKVICPNKQYTGISASVAFANGVGETEDKYLIGWFKAHGYEVEELDEHEKSDEKDGQENKDEEPDGQDYELTVKQIKEQLDQKGIEYNPRAKKDELLELLK